MELAIRVDGVELPATLTRSEGVIRAGVVALHGSSDGERSYFLYEHLSEMCAAAGIAVLRYDRRPSATGDDIDLAVQAHDALAAVRLLRQHVGDRPVGLWGFSQGAWAAPLAAVAEPSAVAFLVLVSACGVSPAEQMRIGTAEQLRRAGFGAADLEELHELRVAVEDVFRGRGNRAAAQARLDAAAEQPWFDLVYLPRQLADDVAWADLDYDPRPVLARLTCPVLAFYGDSDEWMPIEESADAWHRAQAEGDLDDVTVVRLPGADHLPTIGGQPDRASISPVYAETLVRWITSRTEV